MTPAQLARLNVLVAEKVLGRKITTDVRHTDPGVLFLDSDGSLWYSGGIVPFWPARRHEDAWAVVEHMKGNGYRISIQDYGNRYLVNFIHDGNYRWQNNREHCDVCIAICLAALLAAGVDTEKEIGDAN